MPGGSNSTNDAAQPLANADTATTLGTSLITTKTNAPGNLKELFTNRNVALMIPVFLVGSTRYTVLNVLMQYASVFFHWRLSRTALFYTETAAVNIILFLVVVPMTITYIRRKYGIVQQRIDMTMVRGSVMFLCVGALAIGISPSGHFLPVGKSFTPALLKILDPGA